MGGSFRGTLAAILVAAALGFAIFHVFVDTLRLSEVVDVSERPVAGALVTMFDFDTGLTRWDVHRLSRRADYWERRIREVEAIRDPAVRAEEEAKLRAEMLQDPTMRKIVRRLGMLGEATALALIEAARTFRLFDLL